jgi:hypothetical protein
MGTGGSFPGIQRGRRVTLTPHPYLVLMSTSRSYTFFPWHAWRWRESFLNVFICTLFNRTVGLHYIGYSWIVRSINNKLKRMWLKWSCPNLKLHAVICLEGLRKSIKVLSQDKCSPGPSTCDAGVLTSRSQHSVNFSTIEYHAL